MLTLTGEKVKIISKDKQASSCKAMSVSRNGRRSSERMFIMAEKEYSANLITLVDDEGKTHEFELLDAIETDDGRYVALLPYIDDPEAEEESEYYILQVVENNGEEELTEIEDDELLDNLAEIFEERFTELYEDE